MSFGNITDVAPNRWGSGSTFAPIELPTGQTPVLEKDESIPYAEWTTIRLDEATIIKASEFSKMALSTEMSVRKARDFNLEVKAEIIKLSPEMVVRFPVDKFIRGRLNQLRNHRKTENASELSLQYLSEHRTGRLNTISKENADKYNDFFQWPELFDLKRIFELALTVPVTQKTAKKLCENIWIKIEDKHRDQLKKFPSRVKATAFFKKRVKTLLKSEAQKLLLKEVVVIHKISEKVIFSLTKDSVAKFAVSPEQVEELKSVAEDNSMGDKKTRNFVSRLIAGHVLTITSEQAEGINDCFGKTVFDIQSLLDKAIPEAEDEAELMVPSKKRPSTDASSTSEELCAEPSLKKQRTDGLPLPSFDELELALSLQRLAETNLLPSSPIDCDFQPNLTVPFTPRL